MSATKDTLPLQRFPLPTIRRQRLYALILLLAQGGITVTGSIVRVSGSGLGCDTWPQCHEGSFRPVPGAAPAVQQFIEWGNRLLTFVLLAFFFLVLYAVVRAGRRKAIVVLAIINGIGIVAQAVIGGITVHAGLKWYTVALHFIPSMILVWAAAMLYVKIQDPDDGHEVETYPRYLRYLAIGSAMALSITLITGTMVTGAGPHAGDANVAPEDRLQLPITELSHVHAGFMYLYLGLTIGVVFGLLAAKASRNTIKLGWTLIALIVVQAIVGMIQYWTGVPEVLVPVHVGGSALVTGFTALLYQHGLRRKGGQATITGSTAGDTEYVAQQQGIKA